MISSFGFVPWKTFFVPKAKSLGVDSLIFDLEMSGSRKRRSYPGMDPDSFAKCPISRLQEIYRKMKEDALVMHRKERAFLKRENIPQRIITGFHK